MNRNPKVVKMPDPKGRLDIALARVIEESMRLLVQPRSQQLWNALQPHVTQIVAQQVRKLGISREPLPEDQLRMIEQVVMPRRSA